MLTVQVIQGPDRGRRFELPPNEPQLIGRSSEALPIADSTMSRRHAELTPDGQQWFLRDLDSSNGTWVNGRRIDERTLLSPGDQVRCGSTLLMIMGADQKPPTSTSAVHLIPPAAFDVTVESTSIDDRNDESMILASPDPIRAALDHLRVIYDLTELTAAVFERDELLEKVMDLIFTEFKPDRGFILLQSSVDEASEPVVIRYRERPMTPDQERIPVSRTIIEHTLTNRTGTLSTNAMNDNRFSSGDSVAAYGIRSAICVPIMTQNQTFGVIHIDSQLANFTFTNSQLQLLTAVGQHTGLALSNNEFIQTHLKTERLAAVGEAVASLSHSTKNILQGLRGGADAVELALSRGDISLAKQGWPILSRNLDRIYALTMNMLTYSRPPTLDIDMTSVQSLLEEVCELVQPQCDRKGAGLIFDFAPDIPPLPIDPNAMHQAFLNVLNNAIEAVPSKKGVVTVGVSFDAAKHEACVTISDNGPGMSAAVQQRAFEAFISTKGQRGTGLGLAVTKKILTEHGGRIELRSAEGHGTSVRMLLPSDDRKLDSADTVQPKPTPLKPDADDGFV